MGMKSDTKIWRRDGVSFALALCMIALHLFGSLGQQSEVDEEVENLWLSCGFNPREIREQLSSSEVTAEELDLALQTCLIDRHNPLIHIPISRHTKYVPAPYLDQFIALRHQLGAQKKARASAHEIRTTADLDPVSRTTARSSSPDPAPVSSPSNVPAISPTIPIPAPLAAQQIAWASAHEIRPTADFDTVPRTTTRSPSPGPAPLPSPSDARAISPSIPIPAPSPDPILASPPVPPPTRVLPLPTKTLSPPPKAAHHAQVDKKPQEEHDNNFLLIKAVVFSVLGTSLVAFILFCCYRCKKKRDFHAYSQKDDRPLLSLNLSDVSGNYK